MTPKVEVRIIIFNCFFKLWVGFIDKTKWIG